MGNCCLPVRFRRSSSALNPKNVTLLLVGLDNAGKTTIAKRLAGEPIDSVVPTVGFSVLSLRQKGCRVSVYDLGGGPQIRDIWHRYYADAHGVIFVVDATAIDRMDECHQVLKNLLRHEQISGKPVLLLANKQDVDGALDEIDVVDQLSLEKLVNEQKCPTLVELCSALHFAKKVDIGIDNGYKWLIRGIIRDYPSLNNRVLRDLAKQEEDNKVLMIKRRRREENGREVMANHVDKNHMEYGNPFKPVKRVLEEKSQMNGGVSRCKVHGSIPGLVDDQVFEKTSESKSRVHRFLGEETVSVDESHAASYSSEFFIYEKFRSDVELLKDVPNQSFKNFLVRPKSSGARLYGIRPEKRRTTRRKPLIRSNKTGPSPFTDISKDRKASLQKTPNQTGPKLQDENPPLPSTSSPHSSSIPYHNYPRVKTVSSPTQTSSNFAPKNRIRSGNRQLDNGNPFLVTTRPRGIGNSAGEELRIFREPKRGTRSTPNSRKNSANLENAVTRRRHSMTGSKWTEGYYRTDNQVLPLKANNRQNSGKEILLDVTQLES